MADTKKLSIVDFYNQKRQEWWEGADENSAKKQHRLNIARIRRALKYRQDPNRPLSILVIHGSGRHPVVSCAHEKSNSQMLLDIGLKMALTEFSVETTVDTFLLRQLMLEPCNNCVSTCSALCNWSCSCFPGDDMSTKLYPALVKADVILLSTGVNQSMVSSRLKIFLDRLVSMDGGYFIEDLPKKDSVWRAKMIQHSLDYPVYDQRMFGKVAAYFVTSKDLYNTYDAGVPQSPEFKDLTYKDLVIGSLHSQGVDYGWYHANPFYVISGANPDIEYSFDKETHDDDIPKERARQVVLAALNLAIEFRSNPPVFNGEGGRVNRT